MTGSYSNGAPLGSSCRRCENVIANLDVFDVLGDVGAIGIHADHDLGAGGETCAAGDAEASLRSTRSLARAAAHDHPAAGYRSMSLPSAACKSLSGMTRQQRWKACGRRRTCHDADRPAAGHARHAPGGRRGEVAKLESIFKWIEQVILAGGPWSCRRYPAALGRRPRSA